MTTIFLCIIIIGGCGTFCAALFSIKAFRLWNNSKLRSVLHATIGLICLLTAFVFFWAGLTDIFKKLGMQTGPELASTSFVASIVLIGIIFICSVMKKKMKNFELLPWNFLSSRE